MIPAATSPADPADIAALAKGGRTNVAGFALRLLARIPFLFIAGRVYGPELVGRFAIAVVVVELAALLAWLGADCCGRPSCGEPVGPAAPGPENGVAWTGSTFAGVGLGALALPLPVSRENMAKDCQRMLLLPLLGFYIEL